uniref:Uncharacterized protein AlNc14C162G7797 n=1 Tax=Albugo laibachii Nc14 TaxID=890382 RepID=F0WMW1_9STRA|nr:conserved hypothetical protein [Albugo laibachii Nc14]|eukprot:CCA22646.1 conserved hypothetical protein [Albugo laibachii Nc14]
MAHSSSRYLDPLALDEYMDNDGQELCITRFVKCPPDQALNEWFYTVWCAIGENTALGGGRGFLGAKHQLPGGVVEEIVRIGVPSDDTKCIPSDSILSILVRGTQKGIFPIQNHIGYIRFIPDSASKQTLIVWNVKWTPTVLGNVFCCGGSIIRLALRSTMTLWMSRLSGTEK